MKTNKKLSAKAVELLYQAYETELGGVEIYRTALICARNKDLSKEWKKYLAQTENHVEIVRGLLTNLSLDPERETPGRQVVRHIGKSLCKAMHLALGSNDLDAAELVAAECVTLAETKDHQNWALLNMLAEVTGESSLLADACAEVEPEEDEHLYHSAGWARELWLQALDLPAVVPPPEEREEVTSMAEAAAAKEHR
ncbi:MAG TPA: hypothetical protein VK843_15280 [Planctomycetota bacterium]|nr:hypothetical protein [Planctomycetota bacterium]